MWNDIEYSIALAFNTYNKNIIITGYLNANLPSSNTQSARLFEILQTFDITQNIHEPTHFIEHAFSLLDVIIVNNRSILSRTSVCEYFLGKYPGYYCPICGLVNQTVSPSTTFHCDAWLYENCDRLKENLQAINWDEFMMSNCIDIYMILTI